MPTSFSDVFGLDLDRTQAETIGVGDLVRTGQNLFPHFTVVAVSEDKAWLRNVESGADHLAPLVRCRKIPCS
ncbi:hypothetical protein [Phenylobacterium sp.]|jgi:hypothetical protein|uniref:hypothetical protein n=1 Tax=Phenylobacterium sp. TaxID=1871053 RepID=UPI002F92A851